MRCWAVLSTVRANSRKLAHLWGWLCCAVVAFAQSPGATVADTKHDLVANPAKFLAGSLHAWSDVFPLGQLQNQAYGYLFPQGLFFLLADPLPDWVAQRLWWLLVLGVGFSGFLRLADRLQVGSPAFRIMAAGLYACSPRVVSTLGAISSETWPVMLAPWILVPFVGPAYRRRAPVACSLLAVAALGAVNATATLFACVPAGLYLLWTLRSQPAYTLPAWLAGCVAVSAWWIGPLLVLGRYAPPFTDFIENAWVTTRWLNPTEILRGTTSWAPFVDTERTAGFELATNATFVLFTAAVAAVGVAGLTLPRLPQRGFWVGLLLVGVVFLGAAHGPFGEQFRAFLDGPAAALRNVHKADPLVRLPLLVGFAAWGGVLRLPVTWRAALVPGRRQAVAVLVCLVAVGAASPVWSGQLAPKGAYAQVPGYVRQTADWLNANAAGTRTLIMPGAQFARQTWGWTRDEPLQPLLDVPWVVRDAVPLVGPETIRGLDGLTAVLQSPSIKPEAAFDAARRFGVGVVVVRHDLTSGPAHRLTGRAQQAGLNVHSFGEIDVVEIDLHAGTTTSPFAPVRVAGGGESLAILDALSPHTSYQLTDRDADIVTDTPQLVARNYGAVTAAASAALADPTEGDDVHSPIRDYPSAGPMSRIVEHGGQVRVSSSASDATSFGGVQTRRSATAAVDNDATTSWFPTAGLQEGQWIELDADTPADKLEVRITGGPVAVTFSTDNDSWSEWLQPHRTMRFSIPSPAKRVRMTLGHSKHAVGVTEYHLVDSPITRELTVPDTSPNVRQFLFQQLTSPTDLMVRRFTTPRPMDLLIDAPSCRTIHVDNTEAHCGDTIHLAAGEHHLATHAPWLLLTEPGFGRAGSGGSGRAGGAGSGGSGELIQTRRAFNPGLEGYLGDTRLEPISIDAGLQGFIVPDGAGGSGGSGGSGGEFRMVFAGDRTYRLSLGAGLLLWLVTVGICVVFVVRDRRVSGGGRGDGLSVGPVVSGFGAGFGLAALWIVGSWPALAAGGLGFAAALLFGRYTQVKHLFAAALSGGGVALAGLWLAHAPWPNAQYAGDQPFLAWACFTALGCVLGACVNPGREAPGGSQ